MKFKWNRTFCMVLCKSLFSQPAGFQKEIPLTRNLIIFLCSWYIELSQLFLSDGDCVKIVNLCDLRLVGVILMCVSATQALISVDILYMLQACAPRLFFPSKGAQKRLQIWPLCGRQIVLAIFDLTQIFKTKAFYDLLAVNMPTYGSVCVHKYIIILHNYGERKQWHSPCFLHFFFCCRCPTYCKSSSLSTPTQICQPNSTQAH